MPFKLHLLGQPITLVFPMLKIVKTSLNGNISGICKCLFLLIRWLGDISEYLLYIFASIMRQRDFYDTR